jgi:hypothetical protein
MDWGDRPCLQGLACLYDPLGEPPVYATCRPPGIDEDWCFNNVDCADGYYCAIDTTDIDTSRCRARVMVGGDCGCAVTPNQPKCGLDGFPLGDICVVGAFCQQLGNQYRCAAGEVPDLAGLGERCETKACGRGLTCVSQRDNGVCEP